MNTHAGDRTYALPFGVPARLDLEADAVTIEIRPVAEGAEPQMTLSGPGVEDLSVEVSDEGGTVRVRIHHRARAWVGMHHNAGVTARLTVPRGLALRLMNQAGSIDARDLGRCTVEAQTTAGSIRLRDMSGQFHLRSNAGQLRGDRLRGSFNARTDAGQIRLSISGLDAGEHTLHTSAGAVKVELAPGIDVRIETRTKLGSARSSYSSSPGAAAILRATADIGSVNISSGGDFSADEAGDWSDTGDTDGQRVVRVTVRKAGSTAASSSSSTSSASASTEFGGSPAREAAPSSGPPGLDRDAEVERILKLVEQGTLSAREANDMLRALDGV